MIIDWIIIRINSVVPLTSEIQFIKSYKVCHIITGIMLFVNITISEATIPNINALIMVSVTMLSPVPENA